MTEGQAYYLIGTLMVIAGALFKEDKSICATWLFMGIVWHIAGFICLLNK